MNKIMILPGDGIGTEIIAESVKILKYLNESFNLDIEYEYDDVGGISIDKNGTPLTEETLDKCKDSKAVLLGAVGGPKWDSTDPDSPRPEEALMGLRKGLGLFANLRPVKIYKPLVSASTLKKDVLEGVDVLVVRELTGGIYFGERKRIKKDGITSAYDTMLYSDYEIKRIAELAFQTARLRNKKVTSVDKANILESSRLWRETVCSVHKKYRDIELNHMYVDNVAMQLIRNPGQFDTILTSNIFGDILSDEAAMISGSIGLLPSASLREDKFGMYEPIHGSAPDIQGQGKANPIATLLSLAMMFRYSFGMENIASKIECSVDKVLDNGNRTADIFTDGTKLVNTGEMGDLVLAELKKLSD